MRMKLAIGLVAGTLALGSVAALAQRTCNGTMHGMGRHAQHASRCMAADNRERTAAQAAPPKGDNGPSSARLPGHQPENA